jgi:hypothetical protein
MLVLVAAVCLSAAWILDAGAAPEPSPVPPSWQLEVTYEAPMPIMVDDPRGAGRKLYWFMRYQVVNRTGEDRIFVPQVALYTDTGQVIQGGAGIAASVIDQIKKAINDPIARDLTGITGKILQGEDNAKRGIVVFNDFDPEAGAFDIFLSGLSGETARIDLPVPVKVTRMSAGGELEQVEAKELVLTKTLRLRYELRGDLESRLETDSVLIKQDWVMR